MTQELKPLLKKQTKVIELLNAYNLDVRTWEILIGIATSEGEGSLTIAAKLGIPKAAFSRRLGFLMGDRPTKGNPPSDAVAALPVRLVEKKVDYENAKVQPLYLTNLGRDFLKKLGSVLND